MHRLLARVFVVVGCALRLVHAQTTCSVLTLTSPYILVYTAVDFSAAVSVCAQFSATLAPYQATMNTQFGLWTQICNFFHNTQTPFTPPFWIDSVTTNDGTQSCGVLPFLNGQATESTLPPTFLDCFLSFYPLCSSYGATTFTTGTSIATLTTFVGTITTTSTLISSSFSELTVTSATSTTLTSTVVSTVSSTLFSATTVSLTQLTTLTGVTTTSRTRTLQTTLTDSVVTETTSTSTTTLTSLTSTSTTTTSTTLRTLFTCPN